jgi:predicted nucleotidyltransferase
MLHNLSLRGPDELASNQSESYSPADIYINQVAATCRPVFKDVKSRIPSFMWAGVFGSVSRGMQRPDSDVDILVGYSTAADANWMKDVVVTVNFLQHRLAEVFDREFDVIPFIENIPGGMGYPWKDY